MYGVRAWETQTVPIVSRVDLQNTPYFHHLLSLSPLSLSPLSLPSSAGKVLFHRHLALEHSLENMQFCKEVDYFKTLPDNKLEKEARAIAARYVGEGTPKAVSISLDSTGGPTTARL